MEWQFIFFIDIEIYIFRNYRMIGYYLGIKIENIFIDEHNRQISIDKFFKLFLNKLRHCKYGMIAYYIEV